jgi:aminoglycoside phosphotransferase (APT) family kinase protein
MLRREMDVTRRLPASVPAPRLLHAMDDGDWVVGIFEYVDGRPPCNPWRADELAVVCDALAQLASIPTSRAVAQLARAEIVLAPTFGRWEAVAETPPRDLDGWVRAHLADLVALEAGWRDAVRGDALVHLDVRSDNVLLTPTGAVFVDWPHACIGAPGLDLLLMLPSVALEGGGEPEAVLARTAPALGALDRVAIDAVVAALAGYFVHQSAMPDPPGLPTVRGFQRAQAEATLRWIRTRLGETESQ